MTNEQRMKNLCCPVGRVDCVLDTDAYNEVDDQFAIAYMVRSVEKLQVKALYAAPFHNPRSKGPADGMEKSYREIGNVLALLGEEYPVFRGSEQYLENENTPVISDAAKDLAERAKNYSPEHPLYVVAIGAITNVASAMLLEPAVAENCVVVWLGGHARHYHDTKEFNMKQDIAAARIVMGSGVPFVQLPCAGVVDLFAISGAELERWFVGKNPLADFLAANTIKMQQNSKHFSWTKVIWDVTAVAWLLNDEDRFMRSRIVPTRLPDYNGQYEEKEEAHPMVYVYHIRRDALLDDLINKIC